jgi:FAD-binding domain
MYQQSTSCNISVHLLVTTLQHTHTNFGMSAGQYCYVNVPWISRTQWHPFSIMPETRADGKQGARYTY